MANLGQILACCRAASVSYCRRMPRARKHLVCLSKTAYYHVSSRCVRRAFLCGKDIHSGRSYEHRRGWLEERVRVLSSLFSVELCAYAIMSNHYHLVVRLHPAESDGWSDDEVLQRWTVLYRGPLLVQRYRDGESLTAAEIATVRDIAAVYRRRLGSLSWYMKCLNEPIARRANAEDGCTGHFWEARFHSQALCSKAALLAAMAYVDLNPVRAGAAPTPEKSNYTSIRARIVNASDGRSPGGNPESLLSSIDLAVRPLMPFADEMAGPNDNNRCLPVERRDYFQLVDQTGRIVVHGKRGVLDTSLAPLLERLGLSRDDWLRCSTSFRAHYRNGDVRRHQSA